MTMPIRPLSATLAMAASLLLALPALAASQDDGAPLPADAAVAQAKSLIEEGKPEQALTVLRALPKDGAHRPGILFQTGLAAIAAAGKTGLSADAREALLDEAIVAFRAILIDRPGLVRVYLELARAFFLKGEDALSRQHFERVLAGKPPPAVAANVNRFLALMRARKRWSAYFGFAFAPDSNVNAASDSTIIHLDTQFGRLPFTRDEDARSRSGLGLSVWGGGEYEHPLTERLRLRAGADIARREYGARDFDRTSVGFHLGPHWLVDADTEVSLLAEVQRRWAGGRPSSDALGLRVKAGHRPTRRLSFHASAAWRQRDYRQDDDFNGPVAEVSLSAVWVAIPTLRLHATLGHDRERTKMKAWRNTGLWGRVGPTLHCRWASR